MSRALNRFELFICYVMGEVKWVVFVHRGAGSTIGCLLMALFRRPPVEGGRQTIFHVSVATGFPNGLLNASTSHQARDAAVPESHPTQPRRPPGVARYSAGVGLGPPSQPNAAEYYYYN